MSDKVPAVLGKCQLETAGGFGSGWSAQLLHTFSWGTSNNVAGKEKNGYPRYMKTLIRKALALLSATFVAISVLLTPANAAMMVSCDAAGQPAHSDPIGHQGSFGHFHSMDRADGTPSGSVHDHSTVHCANHSCVVGMTLALGGMQAAVKSTRLDRKIPLSSLIKQTSPEELSRPPRV